MRGHNRGAAQKRRRKAWLLARDPRCDYCRRPLDYGSATLDHVVPRSKGGTFQVGNIVLACYPCNQRKGSGPAPTKKRRRKK